MPDIPVRAPRLFVDCPLAEGAMVPLDKAQANYIGNVLRLGADADVLVFNGREGEWHAKVLAGRRRPEALAIVARLRPQPAPGDLHYLFAPLKHARLDYMVQKAVEMGASAIRPVITRHTQVSRVNIDRMRANAIEAAEQCGILTLPEIAEEQPLAAAVAALAPERLLVFCDEAAPLADPLAALAGASRGPLAVVIGPEGGFTEEERALMARRENVLILSLGPRILRADTAAVAALALVQASIGDWTPRA
ncbi:MULTISPECIES: 16S rRNA (uracil(1498)-N(3))-methyltransferase [Chelatococcus]|uniref:Ribosomal RNA small subunit methyltransferase E n=1 Tax=Chelatococcus caeni TaxID=1348468 RepID=A0A840BP23_9HYPH|nr:MULTISPECIES: 16S rRNA (uracil(1498)-N(3))-methyltransferase [Chelatococcus]ALA18141.1 16S rRNA methyltransferase [Chelatococcus sp. CO-6]MBB4015241.1 16S rRNA (uracil1498-N3)-methyltransferase [Chelatococcus caeni]